MTRVYGPEAITYRDNLLKLADYLEEEVSEFEYDHAGRSSDTSIPTVAAPVDALIHAAKSGLFPPPVVGVGPWTQHVFGPGAYAAIFSLYGPRPADEDRTDWTRWDVVNAIHDFVADRYGYPGDLEGDLYPPPASEWTRIVKEHLNRFTAGVREWFANGC